MCEVYYDFYRTSGEQSAEDVVDALKLTGIHFRSDMDPEFWKAAGVLKAIRRRISLADCYAVTLAKRLDAELVTADLHELEPLRLEVNLIFIR